MIHILVLDKTVTADNKTITKATFPQAFIENDSKKYIIADKNLMIPIDCAASLKKDELIAIDNSADTTIITAFLDIIKDLLQNINVDQKDADVVIFTNNLPLLLMFKEKVIVTHDNGNSVNVIAHKMFKENLRKTRKPRAKKTDTKTMNDEPKIVTETVTENTPGNNEDKTGDEPLTDAEKKELIQRVLNINSTLIIENVLDICKKTRTKSDSVTKRHLEKTLIQELKDVHPKTSQQYVEKLSPYISTLKE